MAAQKEPTLQQLFPLASPDAKLKITVQIKRPTFEDGQIIGNGKFIVRKTISEGGFGVVYQVSPVNELDKNYAFKLSLTKKPGMDQLVKMEVGLLRRLSKVSKSFPDYISSGTVDGFFYIVMELLGPSLAELLLFMSDEKFSISTAVRIGLQIIDAIEKIHGFYFIHRDIKPGNMAIGLKEPRQIYLFDFGLARRFVQKSVKNDKLDFRQERAKAPFRGTYHYCSIQQHKFKDACRRDDLWSLMYTLIEFTVGSLPWEHSRDRHVIAKMKQETPLAILLQGCPLIFEALLRYLDKLSFKSRPSYDFFREAFRLIMNARKFDENDPFDWEIPVKSAPSARPPRSVSQKAVLNRGSNESIISDSTDPKSSNQTIDVNFSEKNSE